MRRRLSDATQSPHDREQAAAFIKEAQDDATSEFMEHQALRA
jgi:hypothetical protein